MAKTWRELARESLQTAYDAARAQGLEGKALEKALSDSYPFGQRAYTPYKVWCEERRKQPGDRLWGRETFDDMHGITLYRANPEDAAIFPPCTSGKCRWKPSIHLISAILDSLTCLIMLG